MDRIKKSSFLSLIIFLIPIIITAFFKLIETSIGPTVLLYSIVGGFALGFIWVYAISEKWNEYAGIFIGVPIGLIGMVLLINFFILMTQLMNEMDYQLM